MTGSPDSAYSGWGPPGPSLSAFRSASGGRHPVVRTGRPWHLSTGRQGLLLEPGLNALLRSVNRIDAPHRQEYSDHVPSFYSTSSLAEPIPSVGEGGVAHASVPSCRGGGQLYHLGRRIYYTSTIKPNLAGKKMCFQVQRLLSDRRWRNVARFCFR